MPAINIAIDGPSGAGKSTIAKRISKELGIIYLDTGAMYRTVALKAIRSGVSPEDEAAVTSLLENLDIKIEYIDGEQKISLDGSDVSDKIRTPAVSLGASNVAVIPAVRLEMVKLQREIAKENDVVMDGRDIGTYVLPEATHKFYLTASIDERARRRYNEQIQKGVTDIALESVKKDMLYRDKNDSSRSLAPLSKAEDAIEIDTTDMTIDQVVSKIMPYITNSDTKREFK